uniref:zinc finger protein CONSTANS-LIKE 2-like n=1 Tax=Erigeron canadensis TaxID=72917 RepID=UPI001CB97648|nr:zinc finger protein CONSTANS-LIKE 2-like [Erigeron canadensis]
MKKKCELCSLSAQIYCQSDNASLCYTCDQTVHSANFLVAKHSRTLLCTHCQSLTPWTASGLNLGQTKTTCANCQQQQQSDSSHHIQNDVVEEENDDNNNTEYDETDDVTEDDEEVSSSDESDAENQVVPWSSVVSPRVNSCSSSDECSRSQMKRCRFDHEFIDSEDEMDTEDIDTDRETEFSSEERSSRKKRTDIYNYRSYL